MKQPHISVFVFWLFIPILMPLMSFAQPRMNLEGMPEEDPIDLTVCTQNLDNYGSMRSMARRLRGYSADDIELKVQGLIERFIDAKCDVIAVQELLAPTEMAGTEILTEFAGRIKEKTNRVFIPVVGPSNDKAARLAFLVATDRAEILNKISYSRAELPKISPEQKPRNFSRGPLEIEIRVKPRDRGPSKIIVLVNFHFKSKIFNSDDPVDLEWETARMEMAEAVRRIVVARHKKDYEKAKKLVVLLGDRNSHFDSASAKLLEGSLTLADFQEEAPCRLSKRGLPLCKVHTAKPVEFSSALLNDPETRQLPGTYRYKDTVSWLDDILLPPQSLPFIKARHDDARNFDSGVLYKPEEASDHALAYIRFNW